MRERLEKNKNTYNLNTFQPHNSHIKTSYNDDAFRALCVLHQVSNICSRPDEGRRAPETRRRFVVACFYMWIISLKNIKGKYNRCNITDNVECNVRAPLKSEIAIRWTNFFKYVQFSRCDLEEFNYNIFTVSVGM